jgi:hypothetical protein
LPPVEPPVLLDVAVPDPRLDAEVDPPPEFAAPLEPAALDEAPAYVPVEPPVPSPTLHPLPELPPPGKPPALDGSPPNAAVDPPGLEPRLDPP